MKRTRVPSKLAANASKLHIRIGELLTCEESPYKNFEIRQEYPVSSINKDYKSNRERFDWVILGLKVVIEVHGEQHYTEICFGGINLSEAKENLKKRQRVDEEKKMAAIYAGWAYVVVKYTEKKITCSKLVERIYDAIRTVIIVSTLRKAFQEARVVEEVVEKIKHEYKWPEGQKIKGNNKLRSAKFIRNSLGWKKLSEEEEQENLDHNLGEVEYQK